MHLRNIAAVTMTGDILSVMGLLVGDGQTNAAQKSRAFQKIKTIMDTELTECQRDILIDHIMNGKTLTEIAAERGVNKSSTCRMYNNALRKVQRFARYIDIR